MLSINFVQVLSIKNETTACAKRETQKHHYNDPALRDRIIVGGGKARDTFAQFLKMLQVPSAVK